MGIADWLFGGMDDRVEAAKDMENRRSKPHAHFTVSSRANTAQQKAIQKKRTTKSNAKPKTAKERREAEKRAKSWWGSNSGSHPNRNGWWD